MLKPFYILLGMFFILLIFPTHAQTIIQGKLIDSKSKEPLAFANVTLKGKMYGTTSNESGDFVFRIKDADLNDTLVIHFIGYQTYEKAVAKIKSPTTIKMKPQGVNLDEVIIRPQPPTYYLKLALNRRKKNYASKPFNATAYYREAFFENDLPIHFQEAVVKTHYPKFIDTSQVNHHQVLLQSEPEVLNEVAFMREKTLKKQAKAKRKAERKGEEYDDETVREFVSAIFNGPDEIIDNNIMSEPDAFLDSTAFKKFNYSFGQPTTYEGRKVMVIEFDSRKKIESARFTGTIYLDDESLAFVKSDFNGKFIIPLALKPLLLVVGLSISDIDFEADVNHTYRNGTWYPSLTQYELNFDLEKINLFKANEESSMYMNLGYLVNELEVDNPQPIPDEKKMDTKKPLKEQVFPEAGITWESTNKIP